MIRGPASDRAGTAAINPARSPSAGEGLPAIQIQLGDVGAYVCNTAARGGPGNPREIQTGVVLSECGGWSSCVRYTRNGLRKRARSNARSCRGMHVCAALISARSARLYGLTKRPKNWRRLSAAQFALRHMRFQANERPLQNPFSSSTSKCLSNCA